MTLEPIPIYTVFDVNIFNKQITQLSNILLSASPVVVHFHLYFETAGSDFVIRTYSGPTSIKLKHV
jgi:hypothetical protein